MNNPVKQLHPSTEAAEKKATEADKVIEKTIDQQIADAEHEVDDALTQLNVMDKQIDDIRKKRAPIAKAHRSAVGKLVTLESQKRTAKK